MISTGGIITIRTIRIGISIQVCAGTGVRVLAGDILAGEWDSLMDIHTMVTITVMEDIMVATEVTMTHGTHLTLITVMVDMVDIMVDMVEIMEDMEGTTIPTLITTTMVLTIATDTWITGITTGIHGHRMPLMETQKVPQLMIQNTGAGLELLKERQELPAMVMPLEDPAMLTDQLLHGADRCSEATVVQPHNGRLGLLQIRVHNGHRVASEPPGQGRLPMYR